MKPGFRRLVSEATSLQFVQPVVSLGHPSFFSPTATLFTDGMASKGRGTVWWGVHDTLTLWLWISGVQSFRTRRTRRGLAPHGHKQHERASAAFYHAIHSPNNPASPLDQTFTQ